MILKLLHSLRAPASETGQLRSFSSGLRFSHSVYVNIVTRVSVAVNVFEHPFSYK